MPSIRKEVQGRSVLAEVLLNKKLRYIILTWTLDFSKCSETNLVLKHICEHRDIEAFRNYNQTQSIKKNLHYLGM